MVHFYLLSKKCIFVCFQAGEHSSIKDAEAAMKLYQKFKTQWESDAPLLGKVEMQIPSSKKRGYIIGPKGSKLQVNFYGSEINFCQFSHKMT